MIEVVDLVKEYKVHEKEPGLAGSFKSFFRRKTRIVEAVRGISFKIPAGEMVGFLGPNGAGKTTTLKMLSGLLYPTRGSLSVAGFLPQKRQSAFLKSITLVMGQKQQLNWDLPALDSFLINKAVYEIPDREYQHTMREFTEVLELEGILKKQVRKLSLGERMKCELAAALLHRPKVLFLDEPTIGLDVNMQERIRSFIADYNQKYGATVILTSHYMADVAALCKRIIVIEHGRLVFDGDLVSLIESRRPDKIIKLQFEHEVARETLERFGTVRRFKLLEAELLVPRARTSEVAAELLAEMPIQDITIEDPPLTEIIGELFLGEKRAVQEENEAMQEEEVDEFET
jgi:ABC-2 type transport system ATP-binding protein